MVSNPNQQSTNSPKEEKRAFNLRGFFSLLLFGSFSLLAFSGIILYMTPKGRVANWTGWTMLGLQKEEWSSTHITLALLVLIATGFHLYYNWSIFWNYIKRKTAIAFNLKRELLLAVLLCLLTFFGTLYGIPPFSTIIEWNDDIKEYWEVNAAAPPMPHAEELTIAQLAAEVDMPLQEVVSLLEDAGYSVAETSISVSDFAAKNNTTPSSLFYIIKPGWQGQRGGGQGRGAGGGLGRGMGAGAGAGVGTGLGINAGEENRNTSDTDTSDESLQLERGLDGNSAPENKATDIQHDSGTGLGRGEGGGGGAGLGAGTGRGQGSGTGQGDGTGLGRGEGGGGGAGLGAGTGRGQGSGTGQGDGTGLGRGEGGGSSRAIGYGRMSVQQCCEHGGVPVADGLARLRAAGINASTNELLRTIAGRNDKTPAEIAQIIHEK